MTVTATVISQNGRYTVAMTLIALGAKTELVANASPDNPISVPDIDGTA